MSVLPPIRTKGPDGKITFLNRDSNRDPNRFQLLPEIESRRQSICNGGIVGPILAKTPRTVMTGSVMFDSVINSRPQNRGIKAVENTFSHIPYAVSIMDGK